ncbi:MAG: alpha/beta hydrolase [Bacteroidales bacterium]
MDISIQLSGGQYLRGFINSPGDDMKAIILLVHGLGEQVGRYTNWMKMFSSRKIGMIALDLPGHGKSDGKRGHIKSYAVTSEMLDILISQYKKTFPGVPLFIYGHSLGGGIVLEYLLKRKPAVKGAIITSPWLRLAFEPAPGKVKLASMMKSILPSLTQPSGLVVDHISHDQAVVEAYRKDPLVHDKISVSLFHSAVSAATFSLANASSLNVPALLLHGSDDMITSPAGTKAFASASKLAEFVAWEGGFHELHNETFNGQVFETICNWINKHI